jgi:putative NIF3 family GTP cyclohydrolase 1 type 2
VVKSRPPQRHRYVHNRGGPHWSFTAAEELRINLFYAGHYAIEVFGVRQLATLLQEKFGLLGAPSHPTGL